jgi:hypothetical protein
MRNPRPAWWFLYALLPLGALLLVGVEIAAPSAGSRAFVSLAILGAIALWLRANRPALALRESPPQTEQPPARLGRLLPAGGTTEI